MPFFDDTGFQPSSDHGPLWSALAAFGDQLERWVALSAAYSLQLMPGIAALAFSELSPGVRLALLCYSFVMIVPASAILYRMAWRAMQDELLSLELAKELLRSLELDEMIQFGLLFVVIGLLLSLIIAADALDGFIFGVLLRLALLLVLSAALYWGALFASTPNPIATQIIRRSAQLVWRYPAQTLLLGGAVILTLVLGAVSVAGWVLVMPALLALLQIRMLLHLSA